MNPVIKNRVYGKGTERQLELMAELGGMNEEQKRMLFLMHSEMEDADIMAEMNLDRKAFERVEDAMRAKLVIAVFHCIDVAEQVENNRTK